MNFFQHIRMPFREDGVFGVLVLIMLSVPLAFTLRTYEHFEIIKFSLLLLLAGAAFLALVFTIKKTGPNGLRIRGGKLFLFGLLLFWLSGLVASVWTQDWINSVFGFYPRFVNGLLFYTVWLLFIVLLLVKLDREKYAFLAKVLVFDSLLIALFGILQSQGFAFYEGLDRAAIQRSPSFLGNANFSTMFMATVLPFAVVFAATAQRLAARVYYGMAIFSIIWSVALLASRGALLGLVGSLVLALILLLLFRFPKKHAAYFFAVLVLTLGLSFLFTQITRPNTLSATVKLEDVNIDLRFEVWKLSWYGILDRPWGGIGLGNFQIFFEQNRPKHLAAESGVFDDAHNLYLQLGVTGGLQLVLSFLFLIGLAWVKGLWHMSREKDVLVLASVLGLSGLAVAASFNPVPVSCLLLFGFLLSGCVLAGPKFITLPSGFLTRLGLVVTGVVFIGAGAVLITSEHLFFKAYQDYMAGNHLSTRRWLDLAMKINPTNDLYYLYRAGNEIHLNPNNPNTSSHIEQVINKHPTTSYSYGRAATLYSLLTERTQKTDDFEKILQNINKALDMDPYQAARRARLGYFQYRGHKLEEARETLKESLTLDQNYLPAWILLAKVYQAEGKRPQMTYALEKAFKLRPDLEDLKIMLLIARKEEDVNKVPIPLAPDNIRLE